MVNFWFCSAPEQGRDKGIFDVKIGILLLISGALLAACASGPMAGYTTGDVLLVDDFSEGFDWETRAANGVEIGPANGAYRIRSNTTQYVRGFNSHTHNDVVIEVDALHLSSNNNNAFGVMCRATRGDYTSAGYYFLIGSDGTYSIRMGRGGDVVALVSWQRSRAVYRGAASNRLRVICVGDYLALYVNGQFVTDVRDSTYRSGVAGFVAATASNTTVEVAFDNLTMWRGMSGG